MGRECFMCPQPCPCVRAFYVFVSLQLYANIPLLSYSGPEHHNTEPSRILWTPSILCPVVDERVPHLANDRCRGLTLELCRVTISLLKDKRMEERRTEGGFNHADLGRSGVESGKGAPVVYDKASTDDVGTTVNSTGLIQRISFMIVEQVKV
jgi:hypothetical protein